MTVADKLLILRPQLLTFIVLNLSNMLIKLKSAATEPTTSRHIISKILPNLFQGSIKIFNQVPNTTNNYTKYPRPRFLGQYRIIIAPLLRQ